MMIIVIKVSATMDEKQRKYGGGRNASILLATRRMMSDVTHSGRKEEAKPGAKKYRNDNWKHTQWEWEVKQFDCFICWRQTWRKKYMYILTWVCVWRYKKQTKKWMPSKLRNVHVKKLWDQLFFLSADQQSVWTVSVQQSDVAASLAWSNPPTSQLLFVSLLI